MLDEFGTQMLSIPSGFLLEGITPGSLAESLSIVKNV
jgi:hypothetical protein